MSRYSSNSDDDSYRSRKMKRKRYRSESRSSDDSFKQRRNDRRNRRSRSRSHERNTKLSSKSSYKRDAAKLRSRRSRSPSYRSRRQRSYTKSRSRSRSSPSYGRNKYSKSKRKYKSRSRSRSFSKRRSRSESRSRRRRRSRSSSIKKSFNRSSSESDSSRSAKTIETRPSAEEKSENFNIKPITIPSDDPIMKQQLLDDINNPSFIPKAFKSCKSDNSNIPCPTTSNITPENSSVLNISAPKLEKRKNETVFHDSIAFEDAEIKIQKWVKQLHLIRQRFLTEQTQEDMNSFF